MAIEEPKETMQVEVDGLKGHSRTQSESTCSHYPPPDPHQTLWEEFQDKRDGKTRTGVHEVLVKLAIEWLVHCALTLYLLRRDYPTEQLALRGLLVGRLATLLTLIANVVITGIESYRNLYSQVLTASLAAIAILHVAEGLFIDLLMLQPPRLLGTDDLTADVVMKPLGPYQTTWLIVLMATARIVTLRRVHFFWLFTAVLFSSLVLVGVRTALAPVPFTQADCYRAIGPLVILMIVDGYGIHLWIQDNWATFVQRKRLQLSCVRAEELLTLAMPRDIAHELMQGEVTPRYASRASIAFLYIWDYEAMIKSSSRENVIHFVKQLHRLFCELDRLVLLHRDIYKIENVGNCYVVSSNIPWVQRTDNHAEAVLNFCLDALKVAELLYFENKQPNVYGMKSGPWRFKIGLHSGAIGAGCIGTTRNFYRLFGDTVNVTSRLASAAPVGSMHISHCYYEEILRNLTLEQLGGKSVALSPPKKTFLKGKGNVKTFIIHPTDICMTPSSAGLISQNKSGRQVERRKSIHNCLPSGVSSASDPDSPRGARQVQVQTVPRRRPRRRNSNQWMNDCCQEDFNQSISSYRAFPFTGEETTTAGTIFDKFGRKTMGKLRRTQKAIVEAAQLLDIPFEKALETYKYMSDKKFRHKDIYYIKTIEYNYLQRFLSTVKSNDDSLGRKSKSKVINQTFVSAPDDDPIWNKVSLLLRMAQFINVRFQDSRLETLFQSNSKRTLYAFVQSSFGYFIFSLIISVAVYVPGLRDHERTLFGYFFFIAGIFFIGYELIKHHRSLLVNNTERNDDVMLLNELPAQHETSVELPMSQMKHAPTLATNTDCSSGVSLNEVGGFSMCMVFLFFVIVFFLTTVDEMATPQLHSGYGDGDYGMAPYLILIVSYAAFQMFPMPAIHRCILTVGGLISFFLASFSTGALSSYPIWPHVIGMYWIFVTQTNGIFESAFGELRSRRTVVLRLASAHARVHANDGLKRLFPASVVDQLKHDKPIPFRKHEDDVVILWADLSGFTKLCSALSCKEVKEILDTLYSRLDQHTEAENLWKMDTIGDAYVVIGGLNDEIDRHTLMEKLFRLAFNMLVTVSEYRQRSGYDIAMRIGIHAGPVVSGIIGALRPRFYIFGKTVLEAEILESTCENGSIQVSKHAAQLYCTKHFHLQQQDFPRTDIEAYWLQPPGKPTEDVTNPTDVAEA